MCVYNRVPFFPNIYQPMIDPFLTDEHHRKSIVALLVKLQLADGQTNDHELVYIHKVAWSLGLTNEDVQDVMEHLDHYKEVVIPFTEKERMTILYYLLFFMRVDMEVSGEEEKMVQEFGFRLGFRTALTTDLIQIVREYVNTRVPPNKMLEAIKKYLN